ncbi:MAG: hypothetical protein A4E64_02899 [Syntrophorhabdus sp. PtaU1.Bin058]|nr:MAG: hypothetical protein A4E64_02899 [Syntrophorhabdus sp. PtaU1.Bin058]
MTYYTSFSYLGNYILVLHDREIFFFILIDFLIIMAVLATLMSYFIYKIYRDVKDIHNAVLKISKGMAGGEVKDRDVGL